MDEYIKRATAICAYEKSLLKDNHVTEEGIRVHAQEHNHILHILEHIPAADVEPVVHASWVNAEEKPYIRKHFHKKVCSNCFREGQERWKRCPYCEAKMDGKD